MCTYLRFLFLVPLLLLTACKSTASRNAGGVVLNPPYTGTFANHPYKGDQIKHYGTYTLLEVFKIDSAATDSITIAFDTDARLRISYVVDGAPCEHIFTGAFTKDGEYTFIFENRKIEIPPIIPILYSQYHIHNIRLSLTREGNLLVHNRWKMGGNIFILGGGDAGDRRYYFNKSL
jgi:hypothetical protein